MKTFLKHHWSFRWAKRIRANRNWGWLWVMFYVTLFKLGLGSILIAYVRVTRHDPGLYALFPILVGWFALNQPLFNRIVARDD